MLGLRNSFYNTSSLDFLNTRSLQVRWVFWLSETQDLLFLKTSMIEKSLLPRPARESLFSSVMGTKYGISRVFLQPQPLFWGKGLCQPHSAVKGPSTPFFGKFWSESPRVRDQYLPPTRHLSLFTLKGLRQGPL